VNEGLAAFKAAWQASSETKDRSEPHALADAYVDAHPELVARYDAFDIPDLVALLEAARDRGDEERVVEIDLWLLHAFEPQQIGGQATARVSVRRLQKGV
jgi:hypothetical protein